MELFVRATIGACWEGWLCGVGDDALRVEVAILGLGLSRLAVELVLVCVLHGVVVAVDELGADDVEAAVDFVTSFT